MAESLAGRGFGGFGSFVTLSMNKKEKEYRPFLYIYLFIIFSYSVPLFLRMNKRQNRQNLLSLGQQGFPCSRLNNFVATKTPL
jgi:hypothetical protein